MVYTFKCIHLDVKTSSLLTQYMQDIKTLICALFLLLCSEYHYYWRQICKIYTFMCSVCTVWSCRESYYYWCYILWVHCNLCVVQILIITGSISNVCTVIITLFRISLLCPWAPTHVHKDCNASKDTFVFSTSE